MARPALPSQMKNGKRSPSVEDCSQLLRALAEPVRLRIVHLLIESDELCVCQISEALQLSQPTVSRHLGYLRRHGLVAGRKAGSWVYYALAEPTAKLHRGVMACLGTCLGGLEELCCDRERLKAAGAACD
jgi:ArsR family transcriptional regulator